MSWENEEYALAEPLVKEPSKPKSRSRTTDRAKHEKVRKDVIDAMKPKKNVKEEEDEGVVLDFENMGLLSLPTNAPNYSKCTILILKGNKITYLDTSDLPPTLQLLDIRDNSIKTITGTFPPTLETLWLDDNKLEELPNIPSTVKYFTSDGNPLKRRKNFIGAETEGAATGKVIRWYTTESQATNFSPDDLSQLQVRIYPSANFSDIKSELKGFFKETICRDKLNTAYVKNKFDNSTHILVELEGSSLIAFALLDFNFDVEGGKNEIEISTVCSEPDNKGGGSRIVGLIKKYFERHHDDISRITLDSIGESIGFYDKMGFRRCRSDKLCPMELVRQGGGGRTRHLRAKRAKTRRLRQRWRKN